MNRKIKLSFALILAIVFGFTGFNIAIPTIISGQGSAFALGALVPFMVCIGFSLDQYGKMKKEKGIVKTATATETAST